MSRASLIADSLRFLEENFPADQTWTVSEKQYILLKKSPSLPTSKPFAPAPIPFVKQKEIVHPAAPLVVKIEETKEIDVVTETKPPEASPLIPSTTSLPEINTLKHAVQKVFPDFPFKSEPPSDPNARLATTPSFRLAMQFEAVILSFREGKESDLFLQNIQRAIAAHFTETHLIDANKECSKESWELFGKQAKAKITIASPALLTKPYLLPLIKERPSSKERFLGNSRLLILHPFDLYFKSPLQKKSLWQTLCAIFTPSDTQASS